MSLMKDGRLCPTGCSQWSTSFENFSVAPFTPDTKGRSGGAGWGGVRLVFMHLRQVIEELRSGAASVDRAPLIAVVNNSFVVGYLKEKVRMFCYVSCGILLETLVAVQVVKLNNEERLVPYVYAKRI